MELRIFAQHKQYALFAQTELGAAAKKGKKEWIKIEERTEEKREGNRANARNMNRAYE